MAPSAVGEAMEVAGQSMTSAVLFQYFSLLSFVAGELFLRASFEEIFSFNLAMLNEVLNI